MFDFHKISILIDIRKSYQTDYKINRFAFTTIDKKLAFYNPSILHNKTRKKKFQAWLNPN